MFCVASSLQWSANTIHLATGQLVDITTNALKKGFFLVGITVWPHRFLKFFFLMYLTKENSYA